MPYAEVFGETTTSKHKDYLVRRIAWRLQANEEGGLSDLARERGRELAADSDVRLTAPRMRPAPAEPAAPIPIQMNQDERRPMPGAVLTRRYRGQTVEARVLPHGFEHGGEVYRSLSAVARKVTGTRWNGYHFFRLSQGRQGTLAHRGPRKEAGRTTMSVRMPRDRTAAGQATFPKQGSASLRRSVRILRGLRAPGSRRLYRDCPGGVSLRRVTVLASHHGSTPHDDPRSSGCSRLPQHIRA